MYTLRAAVEDILLHPIRTVLIIFVIAAIIISGGGMYSLSVNVVGALRNMKERQTVNAYIIPGTKQSVIDNLVASLKSNPIVADASYISPKDGIKKLIERYPQFTDVIKSAGGNPIQPLVRVRPVDINAAKELATRLESVSFIQSVDYDTQSVSGLIRANSFTMSMLVYMLLLTMILFTTGFTLMSYVVIISKRKETTVLSIIGASQMQVYLHTPFYMILLWCVASVIFLATLQSVISFINSLLITSFPWLIVDGYTASFFNVAPHVMAMSFASIASGCALSFGLVAHTNNSTIAEAFLQE